MLAGCCGARLSSQLLGRLMQEDRLSPGVLGCSVLCPSGVRTKFSINMVTSWELGATRLPKEGWTGPGWKWSRSKLPCWSERMLINHFFGISLGRGCRIIMFFKLTVPNLFGTRDQFHGRQFSMDQGARDGLRMIQALYIQAHLLLCGLVPNRPGLVTGPWPRGWGPLF